MKSNYPNPMKRLITIFAAFIFLMSMTQCMQEEKKQENSATSETPASSNASLTSAQIQLAGIEFGEIQKRKLSGKINARGEIVLPPTNDAIISPILGGMVKEIKVMQGDLVKKGDVLAYLSHPDYIELQQEYLQVVSNIEYLENEYARQQKLYDEKVSSEKVLLQSKNAYTAAKARFESLELIMGQTGIDPERVMKGEFYQLVPIVTPMDGIVNAILTRIGSNVDQTEALFEVVCREVLYVELSVFERDIIKIKKGQRVTFRLSNINTREFEAKLIAIGGSVEEQGRVVKVMAQFENKDEMVLPGMFVSADIHTGEEVFDALPESAIMNYGTGKTYIFYSISPLDATQMSFKKLFVNTGFNDKEFVQVELTEPLPSGTKIVTNGGYYIDAEQSKDEE